MSDKLKVVPCEFNLFNEGRKYTGHHRNYVLENAQRICNDPATKEKIKLREAYGYFGHGRRILAKKMDLQEIEAVTLPDGTKMVISNIPSNVTTAFEVLDDGTVKHTQEIAANKTGKIVAELHNSKLGGFSWACPGKDGGSVGATRITGFSGFDYVLNPGFAMNRGYVLESSGDDAVDRDQILESIAKATEMEDKDVEALLDGWVAQAQIIAADLEEKLEEAEIFESALMEKLTFREKEYDDLEKEQKAAVASLEQEKADRKALVDFICESSPFFIPEDIKHAMMENDFDKIQPIFESAKKVDYSQLPLAGDPNQPPKNQTTGRPEPIGWDLG